MALEEELERISQPSVEVPGLRRRTVIIRRGSRRIWTVAACLALVGLVGGIAIVRYQRASNQQLLTDALQQGELRDGWKALGAAAALDAQGSSAPATPPAPTTNVLIVNVPGQSGPAGAQGAQGQPGQPGQPGQTGQPGQSVVTSVPGSVPGTGYVSGPVAQGVQNPSTGVVPLNAVGQPIGNGSLTGSTPNPAFPNNGSNINSTPSPGLPNGSVNASNPTSNIPSGTSNLPSGVP